MINIIANIYSGKGNGNKHLKKITQYCYKNKISYTVHVTNAIGHARALANLLTKNGENTLVALGGDGTFSEVLDGIADFENTTLGFIPAGRGNDFARAAKLHLDPIKAFKDILKGETFRQDYFTVGDRKCLNVAGTGLDVAVLERVEGKSGKINYLKSLLYCVKHFNPYTLKVVADGEESYHECIMVGVCNGTCIGGGMKLSPESIIDDGKLNVMAIRIPDNGNVMSALFKFKSGKHLDQNYTTHFLCDEISVTPTGEQYPIQIDGEILYDKLLECKVVKHGLKTFVTSGK